MNVDHVLSEDGFRVFFVGVETVESEVVAMNGEGCLCTGKGRVRSWVEEEAKEIGAWGYREGIIELGTRQTCRVVGYLKGGIRLWCCWVSGNGVVLIREEHRTCVPCPCSSTVVGCSGGAATDCEMVNCGVSLEVRKECKEVEEEFEGGHTVEPHY